MKDKLKALFKFSGRTQHYSRRQTLIKSLFFALMFFFAYRAVAIHTLSAGKVNIQERASKQASTVSNFKAHRGDILDRNGAVLASNLILKKVNLDSTQIQSAFIAKLAEALMMPKQALQTAINKKLSKHAGRKNLVIRKNLRLTSPILENLKILKKVKLKICRAKRKKDKIAWLDKALIFVKLKTHKPTYSLVKTCRTERIRGVRLQTDTRRYYPKSASLAPLIGRINRNKKGISGIEGEFESALAGQDGVVYLNFNQDSQASYFNPVVHKSLKHGQDVQLTIDADIQFHAYAAVKKSVNKHNADSGSAIILKPNGEILAMVNYPADDPNDKTVYNVAHYRNRVLADKLDPGSTMKPFTMLLALDKKKITANEDELIDVTKRIGHIRPDKKYKQMTVKKILQKSHNLGTVNVAERLEKKELYDTWYKLGFGQPLGLIPSIENSGLLRYFSSWALSDKRSLSFGYGPMQANLAQLARAYLVFANEGAVPALKLINNVNAQSKITQVFSKTATHKIANLLDAVASQQGSGYRAQIKGYSVAGKTGTAEMVVNGRYNKKGAKRTFFAGFVPVKKPKYIMVVRLDYPKKCYTHYTPKLKISCEGSNSAAMVFKEAMENILSSDQSIKLLAKK
ncbi:Cell division protein FtsI [Peptidoglycan synthetase] [Bathymodiolus heckerae thiotrophic gill symbiont]|uniref:peptidoglycan D,D-transpeptidase FtsI family protein n=1 Tax=Bathymodiolus heckerae thiotrophic gill symbiont TaxID=1052212 RepID=UPI0010BBACAD|nr:penicillin-binding protein 2 [Bathymodiolus heckerae thiotrophic gill symbiont]SMN13895.1 Cell division protein FtsI [Peptidoglycan synthetase] [Bathymodiolus heckerae thiotrophic gill symbiont]